MIDRTSGIALILILCAASVHGIGADRPVGAGPPAAAADATEYFGRLRAAQAAYTARDFAGAADLYLKLAAAYPEDGNNWLRLAQCRYQLGEDRPAIAAYKRATELGFGHLQHNCRDIARAYARLGDRENALAWLDRALTEQRFEFRPSLRADEVFHGLRDDTRFRELAGMLPKRPFTRDEGWRYDLDYLLSEIKRLNAVYSRAPLPAAVGKAAGRLRERIPELSDERIAVELMRLLALLGHSHNSLFGSEAGGRVAFTQLPLTFYLFPDGLYVIDGEGDYKNLIGSRVVRFDDTAADAAVKAAGTLVRRESDMEARWLAPHALTLPQVLSGLELMASSAEVRLTVARRGGGEETVVVKPGPRQRRRKLGPSRLPGAPAAPLSLEKVADAYWFKHLPADRAVYFQFNQVVNKPDESLDRFAVRLRRFLGEHEVRALVVDLRHNNGGNTYLYPELVRTLVHFDAGGEDRRLFVLIGRNTYSAALNFTVDVERFTRAVFVGEPTGGRPNTHGDESPTVLPFSGLEFGLSCVYWQPSSPRDSRQWIAPAVPVRLSAADYFANRDPALDAVLSLVRGSGKR